MDSRAKRRGTEMRTVMRRTVQEGRKCKGGKRGLSKEGMHMHTNGLITSVFLLNVIYVIIVNLNYIPLDLLEPLYICCCWLFLLAL